MGMNDRKMKSRFPVKIRVSDLFPLAEEESKYGINKTGPSSSPEFLRQFGGLVHCRRDRGPGQKENLVEPEAKDVDDLRLNFSKEVFES